MKVLTIEPIVEKKPIKRRKPQPKWKKIIYKALCWIEDHDLELHAFGNIMLTVAAILLIGLTVWLIINMFFVGVKW